MKICIKCKEEKEIMFFHNRKQSKDGYNNTCKECVSAFNHEYHFKNKDKYNDMSSKYSKKNKEEISIKKKSYYKENREDILRKRKIYRKNNVEKFKEKDKKYQMNNRQSINEYNLLYVKSRSKNDHLFKLSRNIRSLVYNYLRNFNITKSSKTESILGCTFLEFKEYIEYQFIENMSWNNYGEWHLDHITPISHAKNEEEVFSLNYYTNFQPMWAKDNMSKGNRYIG